MDQGIFLFDNQYHPHVIDRVYQRVLETTWNHCMEVQGAMCQQKIFGGPLSDFKVDEVLNRKMGFPTGSYTHFIKHKMLSGNQKYILEHFIRNHELLTLRDMLQNPRFTHQYIFHIADYIFMNLKCLIAQNGTYLIIPVDTIDGISIDQMELMMRDYDNPYTPSRWTLEMRPKVSYAYGESTSYNLIDSNYRIYLDKFTEKLQYFKSDAINDWKVCMSESTADLNLLRATPAILGFDETTGKPYLEVSQLFAEHVQQATFSVHCFLYNEGHKTGYTISPNYIGPTQYLKEDFDEYIATVDSRRLKVIAQNADGGWTTLAAADKKFGNVNDLVAVGFTPEQCWISIPTAHGVCPIYPGNFRVWEYFPETDTLGRMVATDMSAAFPNIYFYKMQSDAHMLFIEWFRDDETLGTNYDDFTKLYRDYIGSDFPFKLVNDMLPSIMTDFEPLKTEFSANDFVKQILLYSSHEYRVKKMTELLQETGLHYDEINDAIDSENAMFTTVEYDLARMPALYEALVNAGETGAVCIATSLDHLRDYDLYVDGVHITNTRTYWRNFNQYVTLPTADLKPYSVIIVDFYDYVPQVCGDVPIIDDFTRSLMPQDFPIERLSANDLVVTKLDGTRIDNSMLIYGLYANEYLIQVPESLIDWEELGITEWDPIMENRVAAQQPTGKFKAVVFRLIVPTESDFAELHTKTGERLMSKDGQILIVKAGDVFVTTEGYEEIDEDTVFKFSKKVKTRDLALKLKDYDVEPGASVRVYNNNVYRRSTVTDLSATNTAIIPAFCGADDPTRLIAYVNGLLKDIDTVSGIIPDTIGTDFPIQFNGMYNPGDIGEVVYLPFPTDRFDFVSDEVGVIDLAGSGVMGIGIHDMVFENGKRISNYKMTRVTNQLIKAPTVNAMYTIIRMHRDSNLFGFNDTSDQSFYDKLFIQSPGFRQEVLDSPYINLHTINNERLLTSINENLMIKSREVVS